jgi:hypothetical protein
MLLAATIDITTVEGLASEHRRTHDAAENGQ